MLDNKINLTISSYLYIISVALVFWEYYYFEMDPT